MSRYEYVFVIKKCPICGKDFHPAPEHSWTIGSDKKLVCSYTCARKWDKEQERKGKPRRKKPR